ncbi:MAG: hypothetical protein U1F57_08270 [bacterium]
MHSFFRRFLLKLVFAACVLGASSSFAVQSPSGPLYFSSVNFVLHENDPTGTGSYEMTINGKSKDGPIAVIFKKMNLSNPNHRSIVEFCEKAALLAMNNPDRYLLTVSGALNATAGPYFVDFSSDDHVSCRLALPN